MRSRISILLLSLSSRIEQIERAVPNRGGPYFFDLVSFYFTDTSSTRKLVVIELSMVERNWIRTVWPL